MSKVEKFNNITNDMCELYEYKNERYGDSFSKSYEEYGLTMLCIRLDDKLRRLKSLNKMKQDYDAGIIDEFEVGDESIVDTLIDLANYSVMGLIEIKE